MNSAAHLPTRIRLLGTEYAVEQHKSVVFLVGVPRGGQHALLSSRTTTDLVSDGFPGLRFARDLSRVTKRGVAVPFEVIERERSARDCAAQLQLRLGREGELLGAAILTGSWHVLTQCVLMLAQGGYHDSMCAALRAIARGAA